MPSDPTDQALLPFRLDATLGGVFAWRARHGELARLRGRALGPLLVAMLAPVVAAGLPLPAAAATNLTLGSNTSAYRETITPTVSAVHVFGEVANAPGSDSARFVQITCTLYGPAPGNAVLAVTTAATDADIVQAGEQSPFDALFLNPPASYDHHGCGLVGGPPTTTVADHRYTTAITGTYTGSDGLPHVAGTVTNNNQVARTDLKVILTYYNAQGTVIDDGTASIEGPVAAGATVGFDTVRHDIAWDGVNWRATTEARSPAVSLSQPVSFADQISGTSSPVATVTVSNVGTGDLHVAANGVTLQGIDAANFATSADQCSGQTVLPGTSCTVGVTFTPNAERAFSAQLAIAEDADAAAQTLSLSGNGLSRAAIGMSPSPLVFGTQLVQTPVSQTVTLSSIGLSDAAAAITAIGLDSTADFSADTSACAPTGFPTTPLASGASCAITITFTPSATGLRQATLTVTAVDVHGAAVRNSPLAVTVKGTGTLAAATAVPGALDFGSVVVGTTSDAKTVTLNSTGSADLSVSQVTTTGDFSQTNDCTAAPIPNDGHCTISVRLSPTATGPRNGSLVITDNATGGTAPVPLTGVGEAGTVFYFAEGFTGAGFTETLDLLTPLKNGTATIDYYTEQGHQPTLSVNLTAGQPMIEDVTADVGTGHQVSARVILSVPGIVERVMHFNNGTWSGSTDIVGTSQPAVEWDFAEGSTLSAFNEFLSLQNPNPTPVTVDLHYVTDNGLHPVKTLVLSANSRITVEVYQGDGSDNGACLALTTCGVGPGIVGVSVQVKSRSLPIVVERPMYVMNYDFGSGRIRDGHVAFGANAPSTTWNFAEGNTINGFNEYLTLQNPGMTAATVTLHYIYDLGTRDVQFTLNPQSRQTALVFDTQHFGIGRQYVGVSVQVTSSQPIVAERPMYMVFNFGSGPVAGAHDVMGANSLGRLFAFSTASTLAGDNDYLTVQNPNGTDAHLTITYYTTGGAATKLVTATANSRHTVLIFSTLEGVGSGKFPIGVVVSSDVNVLVEKPTYSANPQTYGATDTMGYSPPSF